jgi:hypothetical protein
VLTHISTLTLSHRRGLSAAAAADGVKKRRVRGEIETVFIDFEEW